MTGSSELVVLGVIVGAHALRGEVRVKVLGDGPAHLLASESVELGRDESGRDTSTHAVTKTGTGRSGEVRLALRGVSDRSAAEAMRGLWIFGEKRDLPRLGEDEFYWHEVVGCDVFDEEGRSIGRVREIWETGAHDVLVIDDEDGRQVLVPTAREIMTEVDLAARRVVIHVLPGLLDQDA